MPLPQKPLGYSPSGNQGVCDLDALSVAVANAAASAAQALATHPTDQRTVTTLLAYLTNNASYNVKDYGAVGDGAVDDAVAFALAVTRAGAVAGQVGRVTFPRGIYKIGSNQTVPANVVLDFTDGGQLAPTVGKTVTVTAPIIAPWTGIFGGAGTVLLGGNDYLPARWWGALGDDAHDDTAAINAAVACAEASGRLANVVLGAGIFKITSSLTVGGAGRGVSVIGTAFSALQQGSAAPACVLRWRGGANPMVSLTNSYRGFIGMAFQNFGTATHAIKINPGGRERIYGCSFVTPGGGTEFSTAAIECFTDYSEIAFCDFADPAIAILISGDGTTLHIHDCLFSIQAGKKGIAMTGSMVRTTIEHNTFNTYGAAGITIDFSGAGGGGTDNDVLLVRANEIVTGGVNNCRVALVSNTKLFIFRDNSCGYFSAGMTDSAIILTNTPVSVIENNDFVSWTNAVCRTTDTVSRVYAGINHFSNNAFVAGGAVELNSQPGTLVIMTQDAGHHMDVHPELADPRCPALFMHTATDVNNRVIDLALPGNAVPHNGFSTPGQHISVMVINGVGGAMGTITFDANFTLMTPVISPPNTKFVMLDFVYDGVLAKWVERSRSASTVASGGALAGYVTGAFGLDSDAHMHALFDLVVAMRTALLANGIMS